MTDQTDPTDHAVLIRTPTGLRAALGGASTSSGVNTPRPHLDPVDRDWLAACPLWFMATADADGTCDVSPRGDEPGAVLVLDDATLALPERTGNRRGDGYANLLTNGHVGVIFVIPGRDDTLRVNGRADLVADADWFDGLTVDGDRPPLAVRVTVDEVFYHCVKAVHRIHLWDPEYWVPGAAPSRRQVAAALTGVEAC